MRKRKKIELVEALATLCRDCGYKKVTAETFDEEEFIKKVVDLLNHTIDVDLVDEIHQRFYQVISQNKKIKNLLMDERFKDSFNDYVKGLSKYKKVKDKDAIGSVHINNYFGFDSDTFFLHTVGNGNKIESTTIKGHKITSEGDPFYIHNKKAAVYDNNGNELIRVICKDGGFIFKHNHLPFAVECNMDNGVIFMMSHEYHDSLDSIEDIEVEKCLATAFIDVVSEDSSLGYAYVINLKNGNNDLGTFLYVVMAALCSISNAFGKTKKSHTILSLLLLQMILRRA